jgi:adenosylhomocysteine nucleosidase
LNAVGVVAALAAEARTLGPKLRRADGLFSIKDASLLAVSGIGGTLAARAAHDLIAAGASSLMSFGMAGGLDPDLLPGDVVVPDEVISRHGLRCQTSPEWREQMRRQVQKAGAVASGNLLSCDKPIGEVADKAQAFRDTGAVAVDMESLAVAQVAAQHGIPFIAVRVIVDTATDVLPGSVLAASGSGAVNLRRLLAGLAMAPRDLIGLLRLARRYRAATRSLNAVARVA